MTNSGDLMLIAWRILANLGTRMLKLRLEISLRPPNSASLNLLVPKFARFRQAFGFKPPNSESIRPLVVIFA